jgi:predicted CXXCH cytochrome family protein
MILKSLTLTIVAAICVASVIPVIWHGYSGTRAGKADEDYVSSKACIACHGDHYASWARTYHSRMTQDVDVSSVQGDFKHDNTLDYEGVHATMTERNGSFFMNLQMPDKTSRSYQIERTVGSRRIEQYLTKEEGGYMRLPLAYDLVNRRWMSLNGSFFYPDNDNFFQHWSTWDGNCVFCHNVKAQPHLNFQTKKYSTEVAELGIACGSCHGAGAAHADAAASPFTRTYWRLSPTADRLITNPKKLSSERSTMVCGHCHGQRVPEPFDRIQQILGNGDPFNAGEDLAAYYRPVTRDTKVGSYSFSNRFWSDGSPRLTAYEYQGLVRSRCFTDGVPGNRINCLSCHSMHEGDAAGQIKPENRTDQPCLVCHEKYRGAEALVQHTGHLAESTGSRCYNCHMPRVVFGVMSVHPTHDITNPDPELTVTQSIPNACNQCHLDKSVNWAIAASKKWWPKRFALVQPSSDNQFDQPEGPRALFAGDSLVRALTAEAMGGGGPDKPDKNWAAPFLVEAFADNYPIVRFFAANGLGAGGWRLPKPDYLGDAAGREITLEKWRALFGENGNKARMLADLFIARRKDVDIEVGE